VTRLPPSGRAIERAVTAAVQAAQGQDAPALTEAAERLLACDEAQLRLVLQRLVLSLVEQAHPDGLDADDIRAVLAGVVRGALPWLPDLDPHAVVLVLAGTLSVTDEETPAVDPRQLGLACSLTVADLLRRLGRPLAPALAAAFADLEQTQAAELP
jgi:hypothetical protein